MLKVTVEEYSNSTFVKYATVWQNCLNALTMQFGMTMPCAANPARLSAQKVAFPALTYLLYKHTYAYLLFEHMYMYLPYKHMHTYLLYNTIIQNFQMCTRKRLTIKQNHLAIPKALYLEHKMHVRKYCIIENINLPLMHVCCAFITCFPSVYSARHQYSPKFHRMPTCKCISLHTCTYLVPCLALASASRF